MKKIIDKLINHSIKGVDTYSHNGSTWLIFTESKQWVIELTESKTLWYNYNFFKNLFNYTSMDVVENQSYITQWVEDNIVNVVKDTILEQNITEGEVEGIIEMAVKENSFSFVRMKVDCENVIENGVKDTQLHKGIRPSSVEHTIENGVKETNKSLRIDGSLVIEDTIENGVKKTGPIQHKYMVEDIIENGVRHTLNTEYMPTSMVEDIIQSGVKETKGHGFEQQNIIDDIVKDGVKETKTPGKDGDLLSTIEWMKENKSNSYTKMIDDVIENGIKEVQPLPDQSGELIGYGNYYHGKEDRTKAFYNYLEETIKFGVKENLV
jgi:hypothetical protein